MSTLELARSAAIADAGNPELVGADVSVEIDDDGRVETYLFEANLAGYKGWRWCVTIAIVDKKSEPTICDVVVLPGPDALLAPEWIAYRDRIQPGDVGVGDIVPSSLDDTRLVPSMHSLIADEELDAMQVFDLGLGRARVMSIEGRDQASKRWYESDRGPQSPIAQSAPKPCSSCAFFLPIAGSLRSSFGVCANAISPEDARVVSVDHGCGAHSEATL
ncbi:unannotated protein [freshwater metagenome]|uniref:Unannotated protein n=1 Tax=freshwater metagenome TaxID=449393 RepID=A0A6J7EJ65_9ZZZZ|nr:DUF3027 domain-containing protein [Actinomycetota bacterium]MSX20207.1 DUF3027 domain-containing protein [Actinomycetota bacterium]MSX70041.1 DUF3027 domain-containing protein [Actinomycetota bacterium]